LEIGDEDLLESCYFVPLCATARGDPLWAQLRSGTPGPIAHDLADCPVRPESDTRGQSEHQHS
jgi:hypothetical protein